MNKPLLLFCLGLAVVLCSCGPKRPSTEGKPVVFVSILPQKYFVDRISGGLVDCLVMVPPGTNAHAYEPHPAQMAQLSKAWAYFSIGLEFEGPWLPKFASIAKAMRIVRTDSLVPKMSMEHACEHQADSLEINKDIEHAGLDPHIWLSPSLAKIQVATIASALEEIDTANAGAYQKNRAAFFHDIDSLEERISVLLPCGPAASGSARKAFLVFHPTWGYFARDFCLRQIPIETEGKEPSPRVMKDLLDTARQYSLHAVFVQPEYSRKTAEIISRELGATVYVADALAYDWMDNLLAFAEQVASK